MSAKCAHNILKSISKRKMQKSIDRFRQNCASINARAVKKNYFFYLIVSVRRFKIKIFDSIIRKERRKEKNESE